MFRSRLQASRGATASWSGFLVVMLTVGGCSNSSGPTADYDAIDAIVFSEHVQPLLTTGCAAASCHNAEDAALGLSVASYEDLAAGSRFGTMIVPFEPDISHFYLHLTGDIEPRMPLGLDPLRDAEVRFLRRWILEGARDDNGQAMYSQITSKVFVACQGENAVAVLDMGTGQLIGLIHVEAPHSVYVHPATGRLYVSRLENASDNIHVYNSDTHQLIATAKAGNFPALMQITPDGSQLWVTNFDDALLDNKVRVLDPTTLAPMAALDFNVQQPHGLALTADGSKAYVTNILSDNVSVIPTDTTPIGTGGFVLPLPITRAVHQPQQCVLSLNEKHLFVSALASNQVHVLDLINEVPIASVTVGNGPWHLTLSPDGAELWVANWLGESVSIVDVTNPDAPVVVDTLRPHHPSDDTRLVLVRPIGISFGPDGRVYVSCANDNDQDSGHHPTPTGERSPGNVVVFDALTRSVISVAEVPNFARFASFRP